MAQLLIGLAMVVTTMTADDEVVSAAAEAGVNEQDLRGAMSSTGMDAHTYLVAVGELKAAAAAVTPPVNVMSSRVDCIIRHESENNPYAKNPRSGAAGLGQFLSGTWQSTPQGKAGLSVYDASANRAAVAWMISAGRAREFDVVRLGLC